MLISTPEMHSTLELPRSRPRCRRCCRRGSGGGVDEESRQRLEQQVLTELASHPTVTYVRALEEEREGYRDALQVTTCF